MKNITLIAALAALTACTATPEMIQAQKNRCTSLGYAPGTVEHAQCAERGTAQQQDAMNASAAVLGSYATGAAVAGLF